MGNIIKRKITLFRFARETFKCRYSLVEMNIHDFENEVKGLIHKTRIRLGALLCDAIFTPNAITPYPDFEASDENNLVFYDLFYEHERYMLASGKVTPLSNNCSLDVDMINKERQEKLAKVLEFYKKAYELLGTIKSIPLTDDLSLDYNLASECYYGLKDKLGNISEIREIEHEYDRKPDTDKKFYINKGFAIASVDYKYYDELRKIKRELDELWEVLSPNNQENDNDEVVETNEEIKTINLK